MATVRVPKRAVVIGSSCAGKTTFAARLATQLNAKHIELDALHWEPNWKEADDPTFRSRVSLALNADTWVVDGNYTSKVHDLVWTQADTLIWLDPPLGLILKRFFFRSVRRSLKGELLWGHSKENLRNSIFSRKSLLIWILTTHKRRTQAFEKIVQAPPVGVAIYRLSNDKDVQNYLSQL